MIESNEREKLSDTNVDSLVPKAFLEAVKNLDEVEVRPLWSVGGALNFVIMEHNYEGLTNVSDWDEWWDDIDKKKEGGGKKAGLIYPPAPKTANRFHVRFKEKIRSGDLALTDRFLLICKLSIMQAKELSLFVGEYDGEKGLGGALEFYKVILPKLAKDLGISFIAGSNNDSNIDFFTDKLGRYTYNQLRPKMRGDLFPNNNLPSSVGSLTTVQFLHPEDVGRYVRKEEIKN